MTKNRILEKLISNGKLEEIAKDLGLECIPHIEFDESDDNFVACAHKTVYSRGFGFLSGDFHSETDGKISINPKTLADGQKKAILSYGSPEAARDYTLQILRHECRHLYQAERSMFLNNRNMFQETTDMFEGYGNRPEEHDANEYAVNAAETKRCRNLAICQKMLQDSSGKITAPDKEDEKNAIIMQFRTMFSYNPLYLLFAVMVYCTAFCVSLPFYGLYTVFRLVRKYIRKALRAILKIA